MRNFELARMFYEVAALLEARQESVFRVRAWHRGAQTLETLGEDVAAVAVRGELQTLPGIGKELAARIGEYLETGHIGQLEALRAETSPGFLALLELRGLGPKTAKLLHERLGVDSVERLEALCQSREILAVPGIRQKTCENILKAIAQWRAGRARTLLARAEAVAAQVIGALRAQGGVDRIEVAGSLRRMKETVKDVDILVTSREPARVIETFVALPSVTDVIARGDTKATVRHQEGLHVDLRVVEPAAFGAALQYFTGSKEHNVRVREIASRMGWRLSEYGLFDEATGSRIGGETEEEIYRALGLDWIAPELRENTGELEAARERRLPALVTAADIRGDLHDHTDWSDGRQPIEKLAEAAEARGWEYVIVSDHSRSTAIAGGLSIEQLRDQVRRIRELQPRFRVRILAGTECDILGDGTLDFPDDVLAELDLVVASVHGRLGQDRAQMTARVVRALENPHVRVLGHPTGRLIGSREPYDIDLDAVFAAARRHGKAIEINASPDRLDLADAHARRASELGIPIAISTDTHSLANLEFMRFGIGVARRAWLGPGQVLNTRPLADLLAWSRRT